MKRKILFACALLLALGGCKSDPEPGEEPTGPLSPEILQKAEALNAGLVSLKTFFEASARSSVRTLTPGDGVVTVLFSDGTQVALVCDADCDEAPLIGIAEEDAVSYWTLASQPGHPWLKNPAGERLEVLETLPVAGIDDDGFWTVATGATQMWRITDAAGAPVAATGDEPVVLFRAVTIADGKVQVALTGGGQIAADKIEDLSADATANCYVVTTPGKYCFDASVRGNGVGDEASAGLAPQIALADGMTADWLWTDREGLVSDVSFDKAAGVISFTLGEGRGNTLIALMSGDVVVWSWHVWAVEAPQTMTYENGVAFMDRNLGATGVTVGGVDAYGMYYQWGRKDPFYGGTTTETSAEAFLQAKNNTKVNPAFADRTWVSATGAFSTADYAAAHPMTFLYNKIGVSNNFDWLAASRATMWGAAKTLNDPCPPGYKVPAVDAWEDLCEGRQYIDGVSVWDGVNYGMTYTYDGKTAWYPAQGYRNYNTGSLVGLATTRTGNYWSSEAAAQTSMFFYFQKKITSSSGSINTELDKSRSYGYTVRCCKE